MLRFLLRPLVLAVLVTLLIWFGVIVYWQETVRLVTAEDVGIYLVGLPLLVIATGFLLRAGYRHFSAAKPAQSADAPAAGPAPATDERERGFKLALLAVGLSSVAGNAGAESYEALKGKEIRPGPDGELRNRDGFPVHTCRVKDLDTAELSAALEALDPAPCPAAALRALTLMGRALQPVFDLLALAAPSPDPRQTVSRNAPMPKLLVDLLLPASWNERTRALAAQHVGTLLAGIGWPAGVSLLTVIPANDGSLALRQLDAFCMSANRVDSCDFYLLAACDSAVDEDVVASLEAGGLLFSGSRPQGLIPGEAAAAILARTPRWIDPEQPPVAIVGRIALSVRGKSADASGRIGHDTLMEAAQRSLEVAQMQAADVCAVVSDIDQRSSRCGECAGAMNDLVPDLDPGDQFVGAGQALGRLGSGGALFALGLAAAAAEIEEKAVLAVTAAHPTERAAAVLRPYVEPAKDQPSTA